MVACCLLVIAAIVHKLLPPGDKGDCIKYNFLFNIEGYGVKFF